MKNDKSELLGIAFRAAIIAGEHILKNLGRISGKDISTKQSSDFVTRIDKESEILILDLIKKRYPDHCFLAEESIHEKNDGDYRWIIDPLDGTTNFIHEYPVFSVSIALEFRGEVVLGIVYDPLRNEVFSAKKGGGTFLNGKQVRVSSIVEFKDGLLATGFPFRKKELIDQYLKLFKNIFYRVSDIRRAGSAALDLAHLSAGRCDGFFEIGLSPWDIAAGSILVKEAGGIVTDFGGGQDYLMTGNIVSATQDLHGELLKEVTGVFAGGIDK